MAQKHSQKNKKRYKVNHILLAYAASVKDFNLYYIRYKYREMAEHGELYTDDPHKSSAYNRIYRFQDRGFINELDSDKRYNRWRISEYGYEKVKYLVNNGFLPPRFDEDDFFEPTDIRDDVLEPEFE